MSGENGLLSEWVSFADGRIRVTMGRSELGQGVLTALGQIAADEFGVGMDRIEMVPSNTATGPDQGVTSGSRSVATGGEVLRSACAGVRQALLEVAAERFGVEPDTLALVDGTLHAGAGEPGDEDTALTYWDLAGPGVLDRPVPDGHGPTERRLVGVNVPRIDLPDKVFGRARYLQDLDLPGMYHGRILRPRRHLSRLVDIDTAPVLAITGVIDVVRNGNFVGVIAEREDVALVAVEALRTATTWDEDDHLPSGWTPAALEDAGAPGDVIVAPGDETEVAAARTMTATYSRPYISHASIATSGAVALAGPGSMEVWSHTQGVYPLRHDLAIALGMPEDHVTVHHVEGAGCYGHNPADDVALDAAFLARAVPGHPVRVVWSREDEMTKGPFGSAMTATLTAGLTPDGSLAHWSHELWSNPHSNRPGRGPVASLLAASEVAGGNPLPPSQDPPAATGGGSDRNAIPYYDFPGLTVTGHRLQGPLRASSLRALGAHLNVFAIESFIDEVATDTGRDPLAFRLAHLVDPRARAVVETVADIAGWDGHARPRAEGFGTGIGFARYKNRAGYCAVIADVEAIETIRVRRLTICVDVGEVVNPDGLLNQVEGGAIQSCSWTLKEAVAFDGGRVLSDTWETYPILTFTEVPDVEVEILSPADTPALGAGEIAQGPTAAAIGNALFDAVGVRLRDLPLTPERLVAAINAM